FDHVEDHEHADRDRRRGEPPARRGAENGVGAATEHRGKREGHRGEHERGDGEHDEPGPGVPRDPEQYAVGGAALDANVDRVLGVVAHLSGSWYEMARSTARERAVDPAMSSRGTIGKDRSPAFEPQFGCRPRSWVRHRGAAAPVTERLLPRCCAAWISR